MEQRANARTNIRRRRSIRPVQSSLTAYFFSFAGSLNGSTDAGRFAPFADHARQSACAGGSSRRSNYSEQFSRSHESEKIHPGFGAK
jgi:hypothetical protein